MKPLIAQRVLFRRDQVHTTLNEEHRQAYRRLYGESFPLADVPALKDHDFDGRCIRMSASQFAALNRRLGVPGELSHPRRTSAFDNQDRLLAEHAKKIQFLS